VYYLVCVAFACVVLQKMKHLPILTFQSKVPTIFEKTLRFFHASLHIYHRHCAAGYGLVWKR
jgi:hypothetical protein